MAPCHQVPFGSWPSTLTPADVAGASVRFGEVHVVGRTVLWSRSIPSDGGRVGVFARTLPRAAGVTVAGGSAVAGGSPSGVAGFGSGATREVTPDGFNCRTRVHEYGGGAWWVGSELVFAVSFDDQRVYAFPLGDPDSAADPLPSAGVAITGVPPAPGAWRYADGSVSPDGEWTVCVREREVDGHEPIAEIVAYRCGRAALGAGGHERAGGGGAGGGGGVGGPGAVLVAGAAFVSSPRISPDGRYLAWVSWEHPDMPWDATSLFVAELRLPAPGSTATPELGEVVIAAGADPTAGAGERGSGTPTSVIDPWWDPHGHLWFVSDREDGWWSPYRSLNAGLPTPDGTVRVPVGGGEVGRPHWVFGMRRYGFVGSAPPRLLAGRSTDGFDRLTVVDLPEWPIEGEFHGDRAGPVSTGSDVVLSERPAGQGSADRWLGQVDSLDGPGDEGLCAAVIGDPFTPTRVVVLAPASAAEGARDGARGGATAGTGGSGELTVVALDAPVAVPDQAGVSVPELFEFEVSSSDGAESEMARGLFYPPVAPGVCGLEGTLAPLVVMIHGGPTGAPETRYQPRVQFWTSRGFAVADVIFRGSTGFGRAFRERLNGGWGLLDVDDCVAAARFLADTGRVDRERMVIRGGSAGGFTALGALARPGCFAAATTLYGVVDLATLARDTHKFESRYLDRLVGPLPEFEGRYRERSPLSQVGRMAGPVLVLQGGRDAVVPPSQAEELVSALRNAGVEVTYHLYPDEGHGFRGTDTVAHALETELNFYRRVLGLEG